MKKAFILLLVFLPAVVTGQSFWSVVDDQADHNKSHITGKGLFRDSLIVISGSASDISCPFQTLSAYDLSGREQWNINGFCDVIACDEDHIYTAGYIPNVDIAEYTQLVLSKVDGEGNILWSTGYPETPHDFGFSFIPKNLAIAADGTLLVSSCHAVIKSDTDGTRIREYTIRTGADIEAVLAIDPLSYLIHTQNKIYRTDSAFMFKDSVSFSGPVKKVLLHEDTIYTLLDTALMRLDTALHILDTIAAGSGAIQDMAFYGGRLWLQTDRPDSITLTDLQDQEPHTFPRLVDDPGFIVTDSGFVFTGTSFTGQIGLYYFQNDDDPAVTPRLPNIALADFDIDSIRTVYYHTGTDSFAAGYKFNTRLTVLNNGEDTVRSFAVFSLLNGFYLCQQNFLYQTFSGIEIPPGQTLTVDLNRAYQEGINATRLCFQCLAPDGKLETAVNNNSLCKTFTIIGIHNKTTPQIKIYPNPVAGHLILEQAGATPANVEITGTDGKVWIRQTIRSKRTRISTTALPPGIYIVKITSGTGTATRVIIKK